MGATSLPLGRRIGNRSFSLSWRNSAPGKALDIGGCNSLPGNWFAPPDGKRSRLFLTNEKHSFLRISLRPQPSGTSPFAGGERKHLVATVRPNTPLFSTLARM